jgi:serine/threonine protein kinase
MDWFAAPNLRRRILQGIDSFGYLIPRIVDQAAEGLCYFNQSGWVHRDVKPDNFLVDDDGNVKLIDFALARRSKSGLGKALSPRSKIQGTRSYMAPEQIRGAGLDQRADVYSFGCTLYELFAGRPPYTGASADDLLRKHLRSVPPSLEAVYKNITEEFADLVRRALAKDPEKRPKSVGEFRITKIFKRDPLPPDELIRERQ